MKAPTHPPFHPIESQYMVAAAIAGFLLTLLIADGSLIAAFGVLALIVGLGWVVSRIIR